MKKKIAAIILAAGILLGNTITMAEISVMINGEQEGIVSAWYMGEIYVSVRYFFEKIGYTVLWEEETKTAKIVYKDKNIKFSDYDENVITLYERMYVPVRIVMEALGPEADWDKDMKTIIINDSEETEPAETTTEAELSAIDGDSCFAVRFNELMPEDKNYMFSPLSLKYALAMAANGGDEEVVREITEVLGINDIDKYNDEAGEYLNENQFKKSDDSERFYGIGFNSSNSIWINEDYVKNGDFSDGFKKIIKEKYNGTARKVNNENAVKTINDWCDEQTNHKVSKIIGDNDFQACLVNTVYFIGKWEGPFNKELTKKDIFTDRNRKENEIDFMNGIEGIYNYYEDNNIKIIELPYTSHFSMYVALTEKENIDFEKYIDKMKKEKVNISIPKFKTEYSLRAVDILSELGMKTPFDKKTNHFKNMFNDKVNEAFADNMFISNILQKTFIEIDEEGTEAGAVTILWEAGSLEQIRDKIYEFKADSPFTYFIRDNKTGDILFMGEYAFVE